MGTGAGYCYSIGNRSVRTLEWKETKDGQRLITCYYSFVFRNVRYMFDPNVLISQARQKGCVEIRFRCDNMEVAGEAVQDLGRFLEVRTVCCSEVWN